MIEHPPGRADDTQQHAPARRARARGLLSSTMPADHRAVISADDCPDDIEVPSFGLRLKSGQRAAAGVLTCARTGKRRAL